METMTGFPPLALSGESSGLMNHVVNESLNPDLDGRVTEKSSLKPQGIKRKSREDALDNYMPGLTGA